MVIILMRSPKDVDFNSLIGMNFQSFLQELQ